MEFKRLLIVLIITITVILCLTFGITYGWYSYQNARTNISGGVIDEIPTIIFAQNEYITSSQTLPIQDIDRYTYANKNSFSITINENLKDYEVGIEISLINIDIDDELKITNYKYELLQDKKTISYGDFSTIGNLKELIIMPINVYSPDVYPKTYEYELLIWLSEDETNQNDLMNKKFSAKINVSSAIKKERN